jgi:2-dehydro-3-deoxyphosphogluconate aldolase/(4S)-4-hydroxy-2-oxoglutarate aldolase
MKHSDRPAVVERLRAVGAVAVLRGQDADTVYDAACHVLAGGVRALEVTMTVPGGPGLIRRLVAETDAIVGAGSVRTAQDVDQCVDAGACFIVSPACCPDVVRRAVERDTVVVPGAMTPTEVLTAWNLGADLIKVFPAARLGPQFLKDLHGPFPEIPLVPTGGITGENAREYLEAGAELVCLGSWLTKGDGQTVVERAKAVMAVINEHRERTGDAT